MAGWLGLFAGRTPTQSSSSTICNIHSCACKLACRDCPDHFIQKWIWQPAVAVGSCRMLANCCQVSQHSNSGDSTVQVWMLLNPLAAAQPACLQHLEQSKERTVISGPLDAG